MKTAIGLLLMLSAAGRAIYGQHIVPAGENLPPVLFELLGECEALAGQAPYGSGKINAPGFVNKVRKLKEKTDEYTRGHTGKDLNWMYWGLLFRDAYRLADIQLAAGYPAAQRVIRQGLELLSGVESDDPLAIPHVKLDVVVWHVHNWVETNPIECAEVWDEFGGYVRGMRMPELTGLWNFHRATIEARILHCAEGLGERTPPGFARRRERMISEYCDAESVPARFRSMLLRCLLAHYDAKREVGAMAPLVERLWRGRTETTSDLCYTRMYVALYGEGDWDKARQTLMEINRLLAGENARPDEARGYERATALYYANLLLPGLELMRRGKANREEDKDLSGRRK